MTEKFYGVYRVLKSGLEVYVARSCTSNKKLAEEMAADMTNGFVIMPDGRAAKIEAYPHIAKEILS